MIPRMNKDTSEDDTKRYERELVFASQGEIDEPKEEKLRTQR